MTSYSTGRYDFSVEGDLTTFRPTFSHTTDTDGIEYVRFSLISDTPQAPPQVKVIWHHPIHDIQCRWNPGLMWNRGLDLDPGHNLYSKATSNAPVVCHHNLAGRNRMTFAYSDALNPVSIQACVVEETAMLRCQLALFNEPGPAISRYEATIRIDTRDIPYYEAIGSVAEWWASLPGFTPSPVPDVARQPMYSTWYSMHQNVTPESIETQCRLAKAMGCEAVIVDDGWQTVDSGRGYAYCGDWKVAPERIPDMKAHVARVHALGMKYLMWYSVPFVGEHAEAFARFQDKFVAVWDIKGKVGVLDPRFPECREYLIGLYEAAVRDWDLDGLKLDFVDAVGSSGERSPGDGRDIDGVPEAMDRLLSDVISRLRQIKPDIMIEFRQSYIGPLMRKYGNMFRAGDCGNDAAGNRIRTIDIRLLCGDTAAHADMMMWNPEEPVESAALQIIHTLFSVPQISVLLDKYPTDHVQMVRHYLAFWKEHRDALLDGKLVPLHPEHLYPVVIASTDTKRIVAAYNADTVLKPGPQIPVTLIVVNGTRDSALTLDFAEPLGVRQLTVRNCLGETLETRTADMEAGLIKLAIPPSGYALLSV